LKNTCIEKDSGEYTYEHCFLGHTTQKSKKGGGNTGMGTFAHITSISADEDLPADGKGLGSGERIALQYENGQHCWNGPARSTLVVLACAEAMGVYRMVVGTPAVCGVEVKKAGEGHDEL
jgi:protein kinase C substrate 80K-H